MSEMNFGLKIESQKSPGESRIPINRQRLVIGSAMSCDLRLDDPSVSPIHAILEIDRKANKVTVYDLASEGGVKVDGQTVVQADVKKGSKIQIGAYVLELRAADELMTGETKRPDFTAFLLEDESEVQDIFDRRPESKTSLQVVMFYVDSILDVIHFTKKKKVVIGPKESDDFGVPPLLGTQSPARYELVSCENEQYVLNLHPSMDGVVSTGGTMTPVKKILADSSRSKLVPLTDKDFAKITLGDVSFFVNFSPAPPKLKRQRLLDRDPVFARIWFSSLAVTLMVVTAFSRMTVNPTVEIEQLPERIATIIYKPELLPIEQPKPKLPPAPKEEAKPVEKKEPPKKEVIKVTPKEVTKPAPKNAMIGKDEEKKPQPKAPAKAAAPSKAPPKPAANAAGDQGEGARAAGANGSRGKPDSKRTGEPQTKALRPSNGPKGAATNARPGASQVQDLGVVDVFKSSKGVLEKALAGGRGASGAADKLEGYGGFTTKGAGGLGDAGSGPGGGGQSMGLGGLGNKGVGGGRTGTGLGALGTGGNIIGGKGRLVIAGGNGAPEAVVVGAIDPDAIRRAIDAHRDEIKYCYEKEINADNPDLAGRVSIRWVIGASGAVQSAGVASSSIKNANVESCVVDVIKRIAFPPVKGGGTVDVTYPFVFRPSNQ